MGNRRTLIAAAAIVLAAAAGLGVYFYVVGADQRAEDKVRLVEAYVAMRGHPEGHVGRQALADGLITSTTCCAARCPPSAVTDSSLLGGKVAAATISARQFITDASFVSPAEGGGGSLAASIGDQRTRRGDDLGRRRARRREQIAPGDRVDILDRRRGRQPGTSCATSRCSRSARRPPRPRRAATASRRPTAPTSGLITFEVTPDEALPGASRPTGAARST